MAAHFPFLGAEHPQPQISPRPPSHTHIFERAPHPPWSLVGNLHALILPCKSDPSPLLPSAYSDASSSFPCTVGLLTRAQHTQSSHQYQLMTTPGIDAQGGARALVLLLISDALGLLLEVCLHGKGNNGIPARLILLPVGTAVTKHGVCLCFLWLLFTRRELFLTFTESLFCATHIAHILLLLSHVTLPTVFGDGSRCLPFSRDRNHRERRVTACVTPTGTCSVDPESGPKLSQTVGPLLLLLLRPQEASPLVVQSLTVS